MKKKFIFIIFILIFVISQMINRITYVGVIDNPFIYIFLIPILFNVYEMLNKRKVRETRIINCVAILIMVISVTIALPKYSYKKCEELIINTRFNKVNVRVMDIAYEDSKIKSFLRPSFFVNDFYRIKIKTEDEGILNFYINPEDGKWVEK